MTARLGRKRPDQLRTYSGKRRRLTLTESTILSDGFGLAWYQRQLTIPELADRMEISVHALTPHLRSLLAKGEIEPVAADDIRYRRTGGDRVS